ncbi:MAG: hypothetical protein NC253_04660 [Ruminococcus sp.]|nr:hypothetical protein [Ruminococcus sp.]MCM1381542.1 hypothetical protein [Muribaculaceae bacterium]MCM1478786.1 hypothetical protein [Muribaculaceae bacterium]
MKKIIAMLVLCLTFSSCNSAETDETVTGTAAVTSVTAAAEKSEGVYYPPVSERDLGYVFRDGTEPDFITFKLYYNGAVYTSSYSVMSADKAEIENPEGSKLAEVYSNRGVFWSEDGDKLSHIDDGISGGIYGMTGFDGDFRVCVRYERYVEPMDEVYYGFIVFDRLNGITLNKGGELFKDRLHLDECTDVRAVRTDEKGGTYEEKFSGDFSGFVQAVFDGKFIEADYDAREDFRRRDKCELIFYTETGLGTSVSVYPDGYVSMTSGGSTFIEEVSPEVCRELIEEIG